eukprot:TRINITY_DN22300_c0_g1_i1.p1 TRINITY_DN22300_c0_g1~~TRINITY_DN22300_c0_g1_i1.p1  ORF type:complete len:525 (+),score=111.91 TRINITY_DN22300_c0_g1_i1:82-1656(+)
MRRSVVACSIGVGYAGELVESREWLWPLPLVRAPAAATSAPGGQPKPMRYRRRFDKKKAQESDKQLARELWATITGEGRAATGPHETRQPSSVDVKSLLRGLRQDVHRLRAMVEEAVAFLSREGVSEQAHWTTYSVALDVFAEAAHRAGALMCRDMMMAAGVRVLPSLWAKIIRSTVKEPRLAHQYLNDMLEYGVTPDVAVYNALLYVVVRCPAKKHNSGPSSAAAAVADDAVAAEAFRIYYEMLATGVYITYDTYRIMFQAVATMAQFKLLECFMRHSPPIHDQDRRRQGMRHGRPRGLSPIPMAMTAMRLARSVEEAVGCLNAVRNEKPFQLSGATRITVYTGLINACVRLGDWKAFVAATHEAQKLHGEAGDALFFQAILMGCATFTQKALKATPPASTGLYDTLAAATYQAALRTSAARTRQLFRAMAHYYMYTGDRRRAREVYRQQDREYQIRVSAGQTADLRELEQECAAMARVRRRAAAAAPVWDGLPALNTQEKADRLALKNDPAPLVPVEGVSAF